MKKFNKILMSILLLNLAFLISTNKVYALSSNITLTMDKTTVEVGDEITANIAVQNNGGKLGSYEIKLNHSSNLNLISGDEHIVDVGDGTVTSKNYILKYKAISGGNSYIKNVESKVVDWDTLSETTITKNDLNFNVISYKALINIDSPSADKLVNDNLSIFGWIMSDAPNKEIEFYIDDKKQESINYSARQDVINAISGYGNISTNPTPGFQFTIDSSKLSSGAHNLKVKVINKNTNSTIEEKTVRFFTKTYVGLIQIDNPQDNIFNNKDIAINGWIMSDASNKEIQIYLDGSKVENVTMYARQDVINAISGYGTASENPKPGYSASYAIDNLSIGFHRINIKIINKNNNEVIATKDKYFNLNEVKSIINIDSPSGTYSKSGKINIYGWAMSNVSDKKIEIYIDNTKIEKINTSKRDDVIKAISGYGTATENPTPGFSATYDAKNLTSGTHNAIVRIIDSTSNKILKEEKKSFNIDSPKGIINIDSPTNNQLVTGTLKVYGWAMSNVSDKKIEIYVDNTKIETVSTYKRDDVINAIKGYGTATENPTPGFDASYNVSSLSVGTHKVSVKIVDSNSKEIIKEETRTFTIDKGKTLINMDSPSGTISKNSTIKIYGWIMSTIKDKKIEVYVDNTKIETVNTYKRDDVINAIKGYGTATENPTPGFDASYDAKNLTSGTHKVVIKVLGSNNEILKEETRNFTIDKGKTLINIDSPSTIVTRYSNMKIYGWIMSTIKDKKVEVYVDNTKIETVNTYKRDDVINAIKGYGTATENPTPGFDASYDTTNLTSGTHKVVIKVVDTNNGEIIKEETRTFAIDKGKTLINMDGPSGTISKTGTVKIFGWTMSTIKDKKIEVYVDNTKIETVNTYKRDDVIKAINGYGTASENPTPGFDASYDAKNLTSGTHKAIVKVIDKHNGEVIETSTKTFQVDKYLGLINIDSPSISKTYKDNVEIYGWMMSNCLNKSLEIYVNDEKVNDIDQYKRDDVINAVKGYGTATENATPGFYAKFNTLNLKDGTNKITVKIVDNITNEVVTTSTRAFKLQKYSGVITLDLPTGGNFSSEFNVAGWEMSELDNSYVKIYVDSVQIPYDVNRYEREDVLDAIKEYGGRETNSKPGFSTTIPITNYNEGLHTLTIKLYTKLNEEIYTYNKQIFISKSTFYGIDISEYQTVYNWNLVKAYGLDYAIIRSAYRGYGSAGRLVQDSKFFDHVKGASSVGLKLGTYVFSQAINEQEGKEEANLAIQMVNLAGGKSKFQMPIIFDAEYSSCAGHCGRADALSKQQRTNIVKAFCETVKNAGYTPMIYASPNFFNNNLDMSQLSEYQVWVANYGVSKPYYSGPYQIWQYTSDGSVTGINGRVDMNYIYLRY